MLCRGVVTRGHGGGGLADLSPIRRPTEIGGLGDRVERRGVRPAQQPSTGFEKRRQGGRQAVLAPSLKLIKARDGQRKARRAQITAKREPQQHQSTSSCRPAQPSSSDTA